MIFLIVAAARAFLLLADRNDTTSKRVILLSRVILESRPALKKSFHRVMMLDDFSTYGRQPKIWAGKKLHPTIAS